MKDLSSVMIQETARKHEQVVSTDSGSTKTIPGPGHYTIRSTFEKKPKFGSQQIFDSSAPRFI